MNEALKHMDEAFKWLSKIYVNDEAVDFMAMARQELRTAFQILKETEASVDE